MGSPYVRKPGSAETARPAPRDRGGVLLRYCEDAHRTALAFIPADVALRLTALSAVTVVPGTRPPAKGIALADGAVVTVLELGKPEFGGPPRPARPAYQPGEDWDVPGSDRAVLCALGGQQVALTGATVVATGVFDAAKIEDGVMWRGELVRTLDVRALHAQAETAIWAERAVSSRPREAAPGVLSVRLAPGSTPLRPPPVPDTGVQLHDPSGESISKPISSERAPPTAPSPGGYNRKMRGGSP